jgi:cytochrome c oxidase assembly protein subunit 15
MLIKNKYNKLFTIWLFCLISTITLMIVVGGLTRLTDSGLSITKWDLFKGILPPLNNEDWLFYFSLYKKIPQYFLLNKGMTLEEFKYIYYWEYFHRNLGRIIGISFIIPFIFFTYKKAISNEYKVKFLLIFLLVCLQGIIGWFMVKSGLIETTTVSHYKLSLHLFTAFIILSSLVWILLNFLTKSNKSFFFNSNKFNSLKLFIFLVYSQIIIGALVSGLDAGKIYQTWPLMNSTYFPDDVLFSNFINNFSDPSFIQFLHRNLGYLIFISFIFVGYYIFKKKKSVLYKPYYFLLFFIILQIVLGICTLLSNLNLVLASAHQISSIFLIFFSLGLYHRSI